MGEQTLSREDYSATEKLPTYLKDTSDETDVRSSGTDYYKLAVLTAISVVMVAATALLVHVASAGGARLVSATTVDADPETVKELYYRRIVRADPATTTPETTGDSQPSRAKKRISTAKEVASSDGAESSEIPTTASPKEGLSEMFISELSSGPVVKITSAETISVTVPNETIPAVDTSGWLQTSDRSHGDKTAFDIYTEKTSRTSQKSAALSESTTVTTLKATSHVSTTITPPETRDAPLTMDAQGETKDEEKKPSEKRVLLCTAGDFAVQEDMFPPDGLCDLLFYTHVRVTGQEFQGRYNQKSWKTFRKVAPASERTGFGISASYREADDMVKELDGTGRQKLMQLHKEKIQHHGILRAAGDTASLKLDLSGRLRLIKEFKKFQEDISASLPGGAMRPELVLGILFTNYVNEAEVARHPSLMNELTKNLPITILVLRTHISRRMGGTPIIGTLASELKRLHGAPMNAPTLTGAVSSLRAANITDDVTVLLSFTMIVGHFRLNQSFGQHAATWQTESWTMESFQETCRNNGTFDIVGDGVLRYLGINDAEVFCFEDSHTLIEKARRVNFDYKIMRSWAAFDVEFEDYKNVCGKGAFHRLSELNQFLQIFA